MLILQNDKPCVTSAGLAEQVKRSDRTPSLIFIVAHGKLQDKLRAESLAAVYRYILSPK